MAEGAITRGMRRLILSLFATTTFALGGTFLACSSSSSGGNPAGAPDAGGGADSCAEIDSACGQPCQAGNALGIGRFCSVTSDCSGTQVPTICATLGDPSEHFCTAVCMAPDAGDAGGGLASCGENATCQCQGGQCGCYPSTCQ
jgi:hypothetical protein